MKLPNGENSQIAMDKLISYCLNIEHRRGQHKAKRFKSILGITKENANELKILIQKAAIEGDVVQEKETEFGQEFKVDWIIPNENNVTLRTIWEITKINPKPRLISAFIK